MSIYKKLSEADKIRLIEKLTEQNNYYRKEVSRLDYDNKWYKQQLYNRK
ncbi:MAG: hypothetical protein Unbinned2990contig1002_43 [Prokaryotic dsDNA virus sp.]|nr:MAG: hypothetical protein Unbinned2990contig1002_43 [Prokaryotic dsDNA virus sp.]